MADTKSEKWDVGRVVERLATMADELESLATDATEHGYHFTGRMLLDGQHHVRGMLQDVQAIRETIARSQDRKAE